MNSELGDVYILAPKFLYISLQKELKVWVREMADKETSVGSDLVLSLKLDERIRIHSATVPTLLPR